MPPELKRKLAGMCFSKYTNCSKKSMSHLPSMNQKTNVSAPSGFPMFGWTEETTKKFIDAKPLQAGDPMIIYNGQAGLHHYVLARVENPALGKQKRVLLSKSGAYGGATFYRSGKNCFSPTSQTRMLPPVPELMEHLSDSTDVWLNVAP